MREPGWQAKDTPYTIYSQWPVSPRQGNAGQGNTACQGRTRECARAWATAPEYLLVSCSKAYWGPRPESPHNRLKTWPAWADIMSAYLTQHRTPSRVFLSTLGALEPRLLSSMVCPLQLTLGSEKGQSNNQGLGKGTVASSTVSRAHTSLWMALTS